MSKLIAIRVPDDLAARLLYRCGIRKQSKTDVLLEAIERGWDDMPIPAPHVPLPQAEPIPASPAHPNMDALRSICAGNVPRQVDPEPAEDCTPECCECGHKLTGKLIKGVVAWACTEPGCAMYGLEQRR